MARRAAHHKRSKKVARKGRGRKARVAEAMGMRKAVRKGHRKSGRKAKRSRKRR